MGLCAFAKKMKPDSQYENEPKEKNPFEGKQVVFLEDDEDIENADGVKGHLESIGNSESKETFYEQYIKRAADIILSFGGLVILSPAFLATAIAIKIEDPGPVFFVQKRLGQNKKYFKLHKFRSMKMSTPHDVPTHMLDNPDQYITKVGGFLRSHSLDELPQIWDIFIGNMSIIGPRPGLWNQDVLTAERDKYGVNRVKPGLTGWAQINGRDELEIPEKAKLDGEYCNNIGIIMDVKCFLGSLGVFGGDKNLVEGGTGKIQKKEKRHSEEVFCNSNDGDTFPTIKKRILITGANSYIGNSVNNYLKQASALYEVDIIDTIGLKPKPELFVGYDVVFNVAGIAHTKETENNRQLYYDVNRDLVVEIAKAAKEAGVKQFILLSTMSVYGMVTGHITKNTPVNPSNVYGKAKAEADEEIEKIKDDYFKFVCLRPPMVYGKGCKGNYQRLRHFALKSPVFPNITNERSMIYIGNLCEFVKRTIDTESSGLFFPQNSEYVNTSEMVKKIAMEHGKKIIMTRLFNTGIKLFNVRVINKVFGNLTYEKVDLVSKYRFEESIILTEE